MTTLADPDTTSAAGRPKRRKRNRTVFLVVVLGLAVWVFLAVFGDTVGEGAAMVAAPEALPSTDAFSGDLHLHYDHNREIVISASVANRGRFPVTVTGAWMFPATPLDAEDTPYLLLRQEQVLIEGRGSSLPADRVISEPTDLGMASVTIPGGEERDISISARFDHCDQYEPGTGNVFEVLRLDYRHLGIRQSVHIPIRQVVVEAPEVCSVG